MSVLVTVLGGLAALGQHRERWVEYRSTAERLRSARLAFLTHSGSYARGEGLPELVERVESILGQGMETWRERAAQPGSPEVLRPRAGGSSEP